MYPEGMRIDNSDNIFIFLEKGNKGYLFGIPPMTTSTANSLYKFKINTDLVVPCSIIFDSTSSTSTGLIFLALINLSSNVLASSGF